MLVDTHIHLTDRRFADDLHAVLARSSAAGVGAWVTIGITHANIDEARGLAERTDDIWFAAGIHPHHASEWDEASSEGRLREALASPRAIALGETGMDYRYDFAPRDVQRRVFERQIALGADLDLPIVIHCREAFADIAAVLRANRTERTRGVFHCFSEGPREADVAFELGFMLGLGGVLTFKNSDTVREAARLAPSDRLLLETDAPYLAPVPRRGQRNEPSYIPHVVDVLARERTMDPADLARLTTANAARLFSRAEFSAAT